MTAATSLNLESERWRTDIPVNKQGHPDGNNVAGIALYISMHPQLRGRLRFNALNGDYEVDGELMANHHIAEFRNVMHSDYFKATKYNVRDEMMLAARRASYSPAPEPGLLPSEVTLGNVGNTVNL